MDGKIVMCVYPPCFVAKKGKLRSAHHIAAKTVNIFSSNSTAIFVAWYVKIGPRCVLVQLTT